MNNKTIFKKRLILLTVLTILTTTIFFTTFPTIPLTTEVADKNTKNEEKIDNIFDKSIKSPNSNSIGDDPWWNASFHYRKLINITNPYSASLVNTIASITFNYSELVNARKMNSSLKDVRIVENAVLRNYLVQKNYPNNTLATVFFETNITGGIGHIDTDTYMYYGNNSVNFETSYYNKNNRFGVLWWTLDDGSGSIATDSIGTKYGTLYNGPSWVPGKYGNALSFTRTSSQYVRNTSFTIGNTIVVSGWYKKIGAIDCLMPWALQKDTGSPYDLFFYTNILSNNDGDSANSPFKDASSPPVPVSYPTDQNWHHYVVLNKGGSSPIASLWIDGVWRGNATYKNPTTTNKIFQLSGWINTAGYYWNGLVDDVRVFNYALTSYEIKQVYNNSIIRTALNAEREQGALVTIIVRDIDGRLVPNAEVTLRNQTQDLFTQNTTDAGVATFTRIQYDKYNVTVNYTLSTTGYERMVYDSRNYSETIEFKGLFEEKTVIANLWSIDFEIVDWDQAIMDHSFIKVYDASGTLLLANLPINVGLGTQTFRWINATGYYYEVYYENSDYKHTPVLLNSSTIYRKSKLITAHFDVNNTAIENFVVSEWVWANNSGPSHVGQTRIINATIELKNMKDHLINVDVWYKDINNQTIIIAEASKTYTTQTSDTIRINVLDKYNAYGLKIVVHGYNSTMCNGTIDIAYNQTTHQYIIANMSKLTIKVISITTQHPEGVPVQGVIVHVFNGTVFKGLDDYNYSNSVINLTTTSNGYAYGEINNDLEFWYLRGKYNFSLEFFDAVKSFDVNYTHPGQWNTTNTKDYNYTLNQASTIIFRLIIDTSTYMTNFSYTKGDSEVSWGQNMTFQVNFTYKTDTIPWTPLTDPDEILCTVYQWGYPVIKLLSISMLNNGQGNFTASLNSSQFIAGPSGSTYIVIVSGKKTGYSDPSDKYFPILINPLETDVRVHDYLNNLEVITDKTVSQHYNELINITTSYYVSGNPNSRLTSAKLNYNWDYGTGSDIGEDPLHSGYYTFEINTSSAPSTATYGIDISISLENHTTKSFVAYLDILPRTTRLNGTTTLLHNSTIIWINDTYTWIYKYVDTDTGNTVGNLESAFYYWYKIDETGKPIGKTSANIDLENATGNLYVLDFNTGDREVGSYALFITFQKNNYEARNAFIDLTIEYRTFRASLKATGQDGLKITRVKGQPIVLSLTLTDLTKTSSASSGGTVSTQAAASLTKATVKLSIAGLGKTYKFTEVKSGVYNLTIETTDPAYQAFFAPQTLLANITIEKENYVTQVIDITIVVEMDQWIPGFPAFYLLMIIIGVGAVVGSLVTYRYIQLAKIPRFVKTARAMKKSIKLSEPISESLVYPSKKEYMAKVLGERFDVLGVSLDTVLGLERKKIEIKPEIKEGYKESLEKKLKSFVKKKEKKPESADNINDSKGGVA